MPDPINTSLVLTSYAEYPMLGMELTPSGIKNFHFAVRSILEVDRIDVILGSAYLDSQVTRRYSGVNDRNKKENSRVTTRRAMLAAWVLEGWHPFRVGRYLQNDQPEIHAEMLAIYLTIISNSPPKLRALLIGIISGQIKQAFLSGPDMREILADKQNWRPAKGVEKRRRKYINHCRTCRCWEPADNRTPGGFPNQPMTSKDIPKDAKKRKGL